MFHRTGSSFFFFFFFINDAHGGRGATFRVLLEGYCFVTGVGVLAFFFSFLSFSFFFYAPDRKAGTRSAVSPALLFLTPDEPRPRISCSRSSFINSAFPPRLIEYQRPFKYGLIVRSSLLDRENYLQRFNLYIVILSSSRRVFRSRIYRNRSNFTPGPLSRKESADVNRIWNEVEMRGKTYFNCKRQSSNVQCKGRYFCKFW